MTATGTSTEEVEEAGISNARTDPRNARHGPEFVLDALLSSLIRGDGAAVSCLIGAKAGTGARALADAVGGSIFAPKGQGGGDRDKGAGEEGRGGGDGVGESVPPWFRGSDVGGDTSSSPSSSRRFPRELEPLVALFLSGSSYDLLSVKMLSSNQAWGMVGVRPLGDDGSGFIFGGPAPPSAPPPSSPPSSSVGKEGGESPPPNQQQRQKQWQEELSQQQSRAAFIFRLELNAADGCWEVRDVARVGGGGSSGGGAFSLGG